MNCVPAAMEGRELSPLDVEQVFVQTTTDERVHIELPEEYQYFSGAVGRLNKSLKGLVHAWRRFNHNLSSDLNTQRYD